MINRQALLADLQKFLQRIEADLLERSESTEVPEVPAALHAEYEKAAKAERTAQNYEDWRTDTITQAAAAWVLSCVFVRFLEDNSLIDPPKIAGPCERLARARDEHELYFRSHPQHTDREYLLSIFGELAKLPGTKDIFGEHNAINDLPNWLSGDAAGELLNFFQKIDASTGELVHDFTDPNWDTRFLGDLYQDLSEAARKKFALLQTPDFVEEFILDRTLDPAIEEFGLVIQPAGNEKTSATRFKMIDPACGSGHFLLGAFPRLLERWQRKEPGTNIRELTQRALDSIHGVDINPFAIAIAKFRLLLVAMKACGINRLADAPGFRIHVACGDSLLHGENRTSTGQKLWDYAEGASDEEMYSHSYPGEDLHAVRTLLRSGTYHCVVANPPYILAKDARLNKWYRTRFSACHMKYSLAVPFLQQIFGLAIVDGFTGQITANSFMKREFGKKLIESFFPTVDLTHVIDTAGAFIPGHGTPTVILLGRKRLPTCKTLRCVKGIRGEPSTPSEPSNGLVWTEITAQVDHPGSQGDFVGVEDADRTLFHKHPWSIGGGGASELKEKLEASSVAKLGERILAMGPMAITGSEECFVAPSHVWKKQGCRSRPYIVGDQIRDWQVYAKDYAAFPYDDDLASQPLERLGNFGRFEWPFRSVLRERKMFGKTASEAGINWYEYRYIEKDRASASGLVAFAYVATHNHFALLSQRVVTNQHATVVRFSASTSEDERFALIGLLNSSIAAFWLKQVCQPKQMTAGDGVRIESIAKVPHEFSATQMNNLPLPIRWDATIVNYLGTLAREICEHSDRLWNNTPYSVVDEALRESKELSTAIDAYKDEATQSMQRLVLLQEEIDFVTYVAYGVVDESQAGINAIKHGDGIEPGERPFCMIQQENEDGFSVPESIPESWPEHLKLLWEQRIELIRDSAEMRVIEVSNYKRRWIGRQGKYNHAQNTDEVLEACREWMLDRLESFFGLGAEFDSTTTRASKVDVGLFSIAALADLCRSDQYFHSVAEFYCDDVAYDLQGLVSDLVQHDSVPFLPVSRYKQTGIAKRNSWEQHWSLQRDKDSFFEATKSGQRIVLAHDDKGLTSEQDADLMILPPKYESKDFVDSNLWRLRGKLDVPKERWISFPHCEGPDGTLVVCWAGYDHLQQARAISAYYVRVQTEFGGSDDPRLIPLLASLIELLPWLKQWHNEPNANFDGLRMGDYFEGFVNEEARNLGKTLSEIKAWVPPKKVAKVPKAKKRETKNE